MVSKNKNYSEKDIIVLSDQEHVRKRVNVYLGSPTVSSYTVPIFLNDEFNVTELSFAPAVYKVVGECLDNIIDEYVQYPPKAPIIKIEAIPTLGMYTISDIGRGIPIGKHETGKYTPEVVFSQLRSGRNFTDNKDAGVIGQNGMGVSLTCFVSTELTVNICRDKKRYRQKFSDGGQHIFKPSIRSIATNKTGTTVSFQLDAQVFEDISLPAQLMENRAIELAFTNPGTIVEYNKKKYKFKKGLEDVVKKIVKTTTVNNNYFKFEYNKSKLDLEFYVIFGVNQETDEQIFTWVNSSLLFDGGLCNTQFINAFIDRTLKHLSSAAKKQKCQVTKNDVREGLLLLGNIKIADPEYDAQSKTRLTGPNLRKEMSDMVGNMWPSFARKNKQWLEIVLERAVIRHHTAANKKAIKDHKKVLRKKVPGLLDAKSENRFNCQLLITEGISAASMITEARNSKTVEIIGSFPLTGKINNVYGHTPAQVLTMGKLTNLLAACGLVPGHKAIRSDLRFGKIVIATDADQDGGDIFTLLVNLFYTFWPELFDPKYEPVIYRLIAPNVCLLKGNQRLHFTSLSDYNKVKSKYTGYEVRYYKGLGSMNLKDWRMILSGKTNALIPIVDDDKMRDTLTLLFSKNADARKRWLQK